MRIDYLIPDYLDADDVESVLNEKIRLTSEPVRQEKRDCYDSFDWRLYGDNLVMEGTLDGRQHVLELRRLNSTRPLARERLAHHPAFARDLPSGRLREILAPVLEMRELQSVVRVNAQVRELRMQNRERKTVARVLIEESTLQVRKGARTTRLASRVSILPVKGYHKPVTRIMQQLENLRLLPALQDPLLNALSVAGITPGSYSSKLDLQLDPQLRGDEAIRVILRNLFDTMLINEAGTRKGTDSEFLHDFRVAVRRARSALGQIKGVLPAAVLERYRREYAWLGQITGTTRDLDVYLLSFDTYRNSLPESMQAHLDPLKDFLHRHWRIEQKALVKALTSARYRRFVSGMRGFLAQPVNERSTLANARRPVRELACERIWRVYRRILREGNAIQPDSPAEALHDLRKTAKKLRYLMEFFQSLFPQDRIKGLISILKNLQNNLGDFQDFEVQVQTLKHFSQQMVDEDTVPAATLLAMGMLIEGLERRQHAARQEFAGVFGKFSLPVNQAHFRDMFANTPPPETS